MNLADSIDSVYNYITIIIFITVTCYQGIIIHYLIKTITMHGVFNIIIPGHRNFDLAFGLI